MKIISSFKDYYDHALAWASDDDKVIYRRETTLLTTIPENKYGFSNHSFPPSLSVESLEILEMRLVFFCGKCHTFMRYKDHRQKNPPPQVAYNEEIEKLFDAIKVYRYYAYDTLGLFVCLSVSELDSFYQIHYTPVFMFSKEGMTINPCLKNLQFQKVVDSYQAFQTIEQFLFGVLIAPDKPTLNISNEDKIIKHGFDTKWSFRKESTSNKKG
jgi:hypothetical protein